MLVCCLRCRLLQDDAGPCAACAACLTVPAEDVQRLASRQLGLRRREPPLGPVEWVGGSLVLVGMASALAAVGAVAGAILAIGFFGQVLMHRRVIRRDVLRPVHLLPVPWPPRRSGIAQARDAPLAEVPALVQCLAIGPQFHLPLFRRVFAVDFWLVSDDSERVLVTGPLVLIGEGTDLGPTTPEHLGWLGLPVDLPLPRGTRTRQTLVPVGAHVQVAGETRRELVTGFSYRDDEALVLRGQPGSPIGIRVIE